jgi:hypothetical protein
VHGGVVIVEMSVGSLDCQAPTIGHGVPRIYSARNFAARARHTQTISGDFGATRKAAVLSVTKTIPNKDPGI